MIFLFIYFNLFYLICLFLGDLAKLNKKRLGYALLLEFLGMAYPRSMCFFGIIGYLI